MPAGMQLFGADGSVWFDSTAGDLATRVMGVLVFTPASHGTPPGDTIQSGTGYTIHNWTVPAGSKAWAFAVCGGGAAFSMRSFNQSGTNVTMIYTADGEPINGWTAGTQINVYYGYS